MANTRSNAKKTFFSNSDTLFTSLRKSDEDSKFERLSSGDTWWQRERERERSRGRPVDKRLSIGLNCLASTWWCNHWQSSGDSTGRGTLAAVSCEVWVNRNVRFLFDFSFDLKFAFLSLVRAFFLFYLILYFVFFRSVLLVSFGFVRFRSEHAGASIRRKSQL